MDLFNLNRNRFGRITNLVFVFILFSLGCDTIQRHPGRFVYSSEERVLHTILENSESEYKNEIKDIWIHKDLEKGITIFSSSDSSKHLNSFLLFKTDNFAETDIATALFNLKSLETFYQRLDTLKSLNQENRIETCILYSDSTILYVDTARKGRIIRKIILQN
jgi:hypothetical protein